MSFYTLCIIALGLSMDAFAVSISKGIVLRSFRWKQALYISLCFGFFQGIMPAIGFFVGLQFSSMIQNWDHWIGFVLLALIGIPLFIGLGLFFTGSLTFAAISAVFSMATVAFVPIISLIFVLWLITDSVILSILFTLIFGLIVLAANNTKTNI